MNSGLELEKDFIAFLDGKTINQFNAKWQKHLKRMFRDISLNDVIHAKKYADDYAKPDIVVWTKSKKILLGIKTGSNPSMHNEHFHSFYMFLKALGLTSQTLNVIALYHYGCSKKYGHQEKPLSKQELIERYGEEIRAANRELNDDVIIEQVIDRCVIQGAKDTRESIDFLYYGNLEKGLLMSRKQIRESIKSRKTSTSEWIQFGELVYSPAARARTGYDYFYMRMTWPILAKLFYECPNEDDILDRPGLPKKTAQVKPVVKPKKKKSFWDWLWS